MVVSPKDTSRESKNDRKSLKRSEQESKIRRRTTYSVVLFAALFFTDIKNLRISTEIFFVGDAVSSHRELVYPTANFCV